MMVAGVALDAVVPETGLRAEAEPPVLLASQRLRRRMGGIRRKFTLRGGSRTRPPGVTRGPYGVEERSTTDRGGRVSEPPVDGIERTPLPRFNSGPKRLRADGQALE
ncbi:MAG: hypothetical protein AAF371_09820 [Pseudomonadota bacterium]